MNEDSQNHNQAQRQPTFAVFTLGCKVNQYESARIARQLKIANFEEVPFTEKADVIIINTCTVTTEAARKSRQAIRRGIKSSPHARVYAAGCAAEIPGTALFNISDDVTMVPNADKARLAEKIIEDFSLSTGQTPPPDKSINLLKENFSGGRTRAYLKVQDGCNNFCSYCIIPRVRGRSRSRSPGDILSELTQLEKAGFLEVVITGIHLGDYGKDNPNFPDIAGLVELIVRNSSIPRIRLSSIEPMDFSYNLLDIFRENQRLCPHIHLPLQHASDRILKLMGRSYSLSEYDRIVKAAMDTVADMSITTDVMVGFPGETGEDFETLCSYLHSTKFLKLHVFGFSRHAGTKAARMEGIVPDPIKKERLKKLIELGRLKTESFLSRFLGETVEVLVEQELFPGKFSGRMRNYVEVVLPGSENLIGKIARVNIKSLRGDKLYGENPQLIRDR